MCVWGRVVTVLAVGSDSTLGKSQKKQEAKWLCSACGEDRNCNCNAPAVEKLAAKLEQDRQRARRAYEKKKAEQNQQPSHVREPAQTVFASAEEALAHAKNIVDGHPNNVPVRELAKIAGVDPKMIMEVRRRRGEESFTDRIRELPNYCKNIGHLRNQAHAPRLEEALGLITEAEDALKQLRAKIEQRLAQLTGH
jgi:hypothetical protein